MSIGALSKATGVPADTLRTWERRYGFPSPERTESGHRRYSLRTLERLRLVMRALSLGHRPSTVLSVDETTLRNWLAAAGTIGAEPLALPAEAAMPSARPPAEIVETWLGHVERYEGRALDRELRMASAEHGGLFFLDQLVAPFLTELGERWSRGMLGVRHEHFASERLRELLAQEWRRVSDAATGPLVVCATPPGELHVLGLHMAAVVLALQNLRVVFLGANAPLEEIARAAEEHAAEAVVLSAATGIDRGRLAQDVQQLRATLPARVAIVAGGRGFVPDLPDIVTVHSFAELAAWPSQLR